MSAIKKIIIAGIFIFPSFARAGTPALKICATASGALSVKSKCNAKAGETMLVLDTLRIQGEQGPQGPQGPAGKDGVTGAQGLSGAQGAQGPQGPAGKDGADGKNGANGTNGTNGTLDISKCISREVQASGAGFVRATSACLASEFVVTSGCYVTGNGSIVSQQLQKATNTALNDQVYGLIQCWGYDFFNSGSSYTVTAQALCCQP